MMITLLKTAINWVFNKIDFKAICWLSVGLSLFISTFLWKKNNKLSESLEMAQNNIEAYQNMMNNLTTENNALKLTAEQFQNCNDSLIQKLNEVAKENNIKVSKITNAATQTQDLHVIASKEIEPQSITINTPNKVYNDSIKLNDLTSIYYNIVEDSVQIQLNISNTQYLYTYKHKEWKNKKKFLKRLFTLDFKKVWKYEYQIINTNDLINTSDVRIIEITQ